jgi:CO/xanthine dehydrogenase FAD-binding subunit
MTASELAESPALREHSNALSQGAALLGSPLIRNRATIGGNVVNARPAADLPPGLMVMGAGAHLQSADGERVVPVAELFTGPGETVLQPDEILTHLSIPKSKGGSGSAFMKLGVRKTLEISLVSAAAFIQLDGTGVITEARIALASVAPTPVLEPDAAQVLLGEKPSEALFEKAGGVAGSVCRPIDDFRGSAEYRCDMVKVLTKRALMAAWRQAGN